VAGTAHFLVTPLHTYQRRLEPRDLAAALAGTHLYIVTRRPRTTVTTSGGTFGAERMHAHTRDAVDGQPLSFVTDRITSPRTSHESSYWRGYVRGRVVHGEAWHLAALLSDRQEEACWHEVLYAGQAFGRDGTRNTGDRLATHATLQRIYEDHAASEWDIFVTPLIVDNLLASNDDHIPDDGGGLHGELMDAILNGRRDEVARTTVNVIEHMLIAYFQPVYNDRLRDWNDVSHFSALRDSGFRLLWIQLQTLHELAQFCSSARPAARTHAIVGEVPRVLHGTGFTIGAAGELPQPPRGIAAALVSSAAQIDRHAQTAVGLLTVFGEEGPARRVPPPSRPLRPPSADGLAPR